MPEDDGKHYENHVTAESYLSLCSETILVPCVELPDHQVVVMVSHPVLCQSSLFTLKYFWKCT